MFRGFFISSLLATLAMLTTLLPFPPFTLSNHSHPIEPALIAITIGILVNHFFSLPESWRPGLKFSQHHILSLAIILLGSQLDIHLLHTLSAPTLITLVTSITLAFGFTYLAARWIRIDRIETSLIAIGTAICGSSAIAATAPALNAKQHAVSLCVAIINVLGLVLLLLLPIIGHLLKLNDTQFGAWAGISIQAVPQVIAAGISFSSAAGNFATLVKCVRVSLLAPFLLLTRWLHRRSDLAPSTSSWRTFIPPFIIGFFALLLLRSLDLIPNIHWGQYRIETIPRLGQAAHISMTIAMAAIGLNTSFAHLKQDGIKALALATLSVVMLLVISLIAIFYFIH